MRVIRNEDGSITREIEEPIVSDPVLIEREEMRELRDDITLKEAWDWLYDIGMGWNVSIIGDIIRKASRDDYPESFYKQPPIGSFGRFWCDEWEAEAKWGYLECINNISYPYKIKYDTRLYQHFEPGLPTDVDADGMPKEREG